MMKRFSRLITALSLFVLVFACTVVTASANDVLRTTGGSDLSHVEGGSYLTNEEVLELEALAKKVSEETDAGVYIVFTGADVANDELEAKSILKSKMNAGGGYGENNDVIILYVNMKTRTYVIEEDSDTHEYRLSSKFINKELADDAAIRSKLTEGAYADAAKTFVNDVKDELKPNAFKVLWWRILVALGIGGGATGIAAGSHKALPKTKKRHYLKENKVAVLSKNERLIGTNVTRSAAKSREESQTDHEISGGGHGGSNTF